MSREPNFKKSLETANQLLLSCNLLQFPFSITKLLKEIKIVNVKSCKYSTYQNKTGIDLRIETNSVDGQMREENGVFYIYYNDIDYVLEHQRWTIVHELGHILLNHKMDGVNRPEDEVEANFFAAQVLMPISIIEEVKRRGYNISINFLTCNFSVSKKAAEKRINFIKKEMDRSKLEKEMDTSIVSMLQDFLNVIAPEQSRTLDYLDYDLEMENERDSWR